MSLMLVVSEVVSQDPRPSIQPRPLKLSPWLLLQWLQERLFIWSSNGIRISPLVRGKVIKDITWTTSSYFVMACKQTKRGIGVALGYFLINAPKNDGAHCCSLLGESRRNLVFICFKKVCFCTPAHRYLTPCYLYALLLEMGKSGLCISYKDSRWTCLIMICIHTQLIT